ncbi:DNA/RNA-binding protein KIN17 [Galdieria sulphuraria]|nr:DNA/RNA-binding protein KIN17 [Galdieria sulphuraria]
MGKSEGFLTPKAISKRIKAKGLQRLRWYCQLCQKQCRDENGFKCHTESESHQRMMLLFADAPGRFVGQYSTEFRNAFLDVLKHRFGTKRVHANVVYQEYIKDRDHVHMNSTRWSTLTGFVAYLGREGFCEVEETEQGLFIRKGSPERRAKTRANNKEATRGGIKERSSQFGTLCLKPAQARLADENIEEKVSPLTHSPAENKFQEDTKEQGVTYKQLNWLEENLVVRVKNTELENGYYFKRKGVIKEVFDLYIADVEILQLGDLIRLDQEDLEPVIPQPGGQVRVIYGENKGTNATILSLDMERKTACLKPETQSESSLMLNDVPLQYICKRAQ